jgi:hypothetical protein
MSLNLDEKLRLEEGMMEPAEDFWADYVRRGNSMKINARGVLKRLNDLRPKLFSQPEKMQFDILDVASRFCFARIEETLTSVSPLQKRVSPVTLKFDLVQ